MKPGTRVRILTHSGKEFEGTVLPSDHLVLKLEDGYNIGIDERNVRSVEEIGKVKKSATKTEAPKADAAKPKVVILHTGGTIASKVDYQTGGTSNLSTPEELLAMYPELQEVAHVEAEFLVNMSSDDMRFAHYNAMVDAVERTLKKHSPAGIIITQGTDTLHYTSAAMHYALRGLPVPVVLTGSQRSSDRGSSDALTNLHAACRFIVEAGRAGVFAAMHDSLDDTSIGIFRGINLRKNHTSRRDAFGSINVPQVARVTKDEVHVLCTPPEQERNFSPTRFNPDLKVGMCYVHPNFWPGELSCYAGFDGLVVLGTGLGHSPINMTDDATAVHEETRAALEELTERMPIVMATQCLSGRVNMQVYSAGRRHQEIGVLGHGSALAPETAFIKLAWLLSQGLDARTQYGTDYGDSIERTEEQTYERS